MSKRNSHNRDVLHSLGEIPQWLVDQVSLEKAKRSSTNNTNTANTPVKTVITTPVTPTTPPSLPSAADNSGKGTAVIEVDPDDILPPSNTTSSPTTSDVGNKRQPSWFVNGFSYLNDQPIDPDTRAPMLKMDMLVCKAVVPARNVPKFMHPLLVNSDGPKYYGRALPIEGGKFFLCVVYKNAAALSYFERDKKSIAVNLYDELEGYMWGNDGTPKGNTKTVAVKDNGAGS